MNVFVDAKVCHLNRSKGHKVSFFIYYYRTDKNGPLTQGFFYQVPVYCILKPATSPALISTSPYPKYLPNPIYSSTQTG